MEIIIITGMSGAGKTSAVNIAQDNDYTSIDNLPPELIYSYIDLLKEKNTEVEKLAFVIDIRAGSLLSGIEEVIGDLRKQGHNLKVVFIDANDDELIRRYQEKRRPHPYKDMVLENAIKKEREDLLKIRELSDYYIDTSSNSLNQLNARLLEILQVKNEANLKFVSFGFKYGILKEADYIFDVRFIDNPFYIEELKHKSGKDEEVEKYVMSYSKAETFVDKITDLIDYIAPSFTEQSKNNLLIGIGCTGGQHRSVAIAEKLHNSLKGKYNSSVFHRDSDKWH